MHVFALYFVVKVLVRWARDFPPESEPSGEPDVLGTVKNAAAPMLSRAADEVLHPLNWKRGIR